MNWAAYNAFPGGAAHPRSTEAPATASFFRPLSQAGGKFPSDILSAEDSFSNGLEAEKRQTCETRRVYGDSPLHLLTVGVAL